MFNIQLTYRTAGRREYSVRKGDRHWTVSHNVVTGQWIVSNDARMWLRPEGPTGRVIIRACKMHFHALEPEATA